MRRLGGRRCGAEVRWRRAFEWEDEREKREYKKRGKGKKKNIKTWDPLTAGVWGGGWEDPIFRELEEVFWSPPSLGVQLGGLLELVFYPNF